MPSFPNSVRRNCFKLSEQCSALAKDSDSDLGMDEPALPATEEDDGTRYAVGVIFRDAKAQETKKTPFLKLCCAGPNRFKAAKNAVHAPEFFNKGSEPQTVKQCALHAVTASLVRESGALHGARVNAGF